jgi:hypothetical protein
LVTAKREVRYIIVVVLLVGAYFSFRLAASPDPNLLLVARTFAFLTGSVLVCLALVVLGFFKKAKFEKWLVFE